uniref:Uncharacterized protein n=1 Tax=Arundo donax TaxID=35708 RepID=A0A0A9C8Y0_ARUDO
MEEIHFTTLNYLVCPLNPPNKIPSQFTLPNYLN